MTCWPVGYRRQKVNGPADRLTRVLAKRVKKVGREEVQTIRILIGTDLEVGQGFTKFLKENHRGKPEAFSPTHERAHCPATQFIEAVSAVPLRKGRMWPSSLSSDFRLRPNHFQGHEALDFDDWKLHCHCFTHENIAGGGLVP